MTLQQLTLLVQEVPVSVHVVLRVQSTVMWGSISCEGDEERGTRTFWSTVMCSENPKESLTLTLEAIISQSSDDDDAESTLMMMMRPSGTPTSSCIARRLFAACSHSPQHLVAVEQRTLSQTADSYTNLIMRCLTTDCYLREIMYFRQK